MEIDKWRGELSSKSDQNITVRQHIENIEDEKQRIRYQIGLDVIYSLSKTDGKLEDINEVLVWQTGTREEDRELVFKLKKSIDPRQKRF